MLPSVLLHDHLDGGLRPETCLDLANQHGYNDLPANDAEELHAWFDQSASGSLEGYLESFDHTIGVMQQASAIERVAYEAGVDVASHGVVYAEFRFCPGLFTNGGLTLEEVIEAAASGFSKAGAETGLVWGIIVDAMRQLEDSMEMARAAVSCRGLGVVGFDIAGPEQGFPPANHLAACRLVRESGLRLTLHAGEAGGKHGVAYMAQAMDVCGAERLGHGIEIINDCLVEDGNITKLGAVARRVRDRQIPLEVCPTSNMATGSLRPEEHPLGALHRAGFNVTLSTDNRLMSQTSMPAEFEFATTHHDITVDDLAVITRRSLAAAFCDHDVKQQLWHDRIRPAYTDAGATPGVLH